MSVWESESADGRQVHCRIESGLFVCVCGVWFFLYSIRLVPVSLSVSTSVSLSVCAGVWNFMQISLPPLYMYAENKNKSLCLCLCVSLTIKTKTVFADTVQWVYDTMAPIQQPQSAAVNENLPQFVALCKKVHCTLINQNSGPPSYSNNNEKNNNFTLFYYKHKAYTHFYGILRFGWCFWYVLFCFPINHSNEPPKWAQHFGWLKNTQLQQLRRSLSWCHSTPTAAGDVQWIRLITIKLNIIFIWRWWV